MWHKPCRTFHPWCPCIKTRCLSILFLSLPRYPDNWSNLEGCGKIDLGPVSPTAFPSHIQIRWKFRFTLTSIPIQRPLQNFVHGMTAVLSCQVQKLLRSDSQQQNYSKAKFPSNLNCGQNLLVKRAPVPNKEKQNKNPKLGAYFFGWTLYDTPSLETIYMNVTFTYFIISQLLNSKSAIQEYMVHVIMRIMGLVTLGCTRNWLAPIRTQLSRHT